MKEKKNSEDKERILLNIFETFKKMCEENDKSKREKEDVIDVTGEDEAGGTSSRIIKCPKCAYKSTIQGRMNQHLRDKHNQQSESIDKPNQNSSNDTIVELPCDECDYKATKAPDYLEHIKTHGDKDPSGEIPCDICDYNAKDISDFKIHIQKTHGRKVESAGQKENSGRTKEAKKTTPKTKGINCEF